MYHKRLRYFFVALFCVSQTKAGVNNEVRVAYNQETQLDATGNQQKTSAHVTGSVNAEAPSRKLSTGKNVTPSHTQDDKSRNINLKSDSSGFTQSGGGASYSTPVPMIGNSGGFTGNTGTHDMAVQHGSSAHLPSTRYDDPKVQGAHTAGTAGTYAFDSSKQPTPGSLQLSSVDIKPTFQVSGTGVVHSTPDLLQYSSGGNVQNSKTEFPSYSPANTGVVIQGQTNKPTATSASNIGGNFALPGTSIPQYGVGTTTANSGGSGYVLPSGSNLPQINVGTNTANNGGSGYVVPSGTSSPQNNIRTTTANSGGVGYVLPSGGSIPQKSYEVQGSQTSSGTIQTTRINSGLPVTSSGGGSIYTPTYNPGGTASINSGGFGGSYGQTSGGFVPGYNIGIRVPSMTVRPVGGQISGGMLSGVMFPAGTQQIKVGYGTSGTIGQMQSVPQTQVRSVNQIPTFQRVSVPTMRVNPVYTSVATSGRVPATTGIAYSSIPTAGVRMSYGQNMIRSPSGFTGAQVRLPSTNIQYMSSAAIPMGAMQVSGR